MVIKMLSRNHHHFDQMKEKVIMILFTGKFVTNQVC